MSGTKTLVKGQRLSKKVCIILWEQMQNQLTSHFDLLNYLQQLHFCRHVAHGPHTFCHIFVVQVAILIVVKLLEGFLQLCKKGRVTREEFPSFITAACWKIMQVLQTTLLKLSLCERVEFPDHNLECGKAAIKGCD